MDRLARRDRQEVAEHPDNQAREALKARLGHKVPLARRALKGSKAFQDRRAVQDRRGRRVVRVFLVTSSHNRQQLRLET